MLKKITKSAGLVVLVIIMVHTGFSRVLDLKKAVFTIMPLDTCITPAKLVKTNIVQSRQTSIDEACEEIILDEGFETEEGADYEARIGSGYTNSAPIVKYKTNVTPNAEIEVLIRPQSNRILLRWITENPEYWKYSIGTGYTLERQELINGNWVQNYSIHFNSVVENDYAQWQPFFSDSTYALIYYGITDQHRAPNAPAEETFYRYFGVSYAFNYNFDAAIKAKHGYIDNNVVAGKRYRYRVTSLLPVSPSSISSGDYIEVQTEAAAELPKANINLSVSKTTSYQKVTVDWLGKPLIGYYSGYNIERSTDGVNFVKINNRPLVYMPSKKDSMNVQKDPADRVYFIDSLANKTQKYYYRVVAKSYFNEYQSFEAKSVQLWKEYPWVPHIDSIRFSKATQKYTVHWKFPQDGNISAMDTILKANPYTLKVSTKDTSDYVILKTNILTGSRNVTFTKNELAALVDTNSKFYYRVCAITKDGVELKSIPSLVIPVDRIPPVKPTGLSVNVIANDIEKKITILNITWNANLESDLLGYTIQRRIGETDSLYIVADTRLMNKVGNSIQKNTNRIARDTLFNNLDMRKIYYYIRAYDENYNGSDTAMIAYVIADKKRPVVPTMVRARFDAANSNVRLSLIPSPEKDVYHRILKKEEQGSWMLLKEYNKSQRDTLYIDNSVTVGKTYYYTYNAYDDVNNMSCFKDPQSANLDLPIVDCYQFMSVSIGNSSVQLIPIIGTFSLTKNLTSKEIELNWTLTSTLTPIREFEIYKAVYNNQTPANLKRESLWQVVDDGELTIKDDNPIADYTHKYLIRAVFEDGKTSAWKEATIVF